MGDITQCDADVIVNAANETLLGGGGVDGAIHDAAGHGLFEECEALGGCPTGEVRVTAAHDLPFDAIVHAVGPIWQGGNWNEEELLRNCYENALRAAADLQAQSIAFPAISTGAFAFPEALAASIATRTCLSWKRDFPERVLLVAFDEGSEAIMNDALRKSTASFIEFGGGNVF